jgi:hypothetical protein
MSDVVVPGRVGKEERRLDYKDDAAQGEEEAGNLEWANALLEEATGEQCCEHGSGSTDDVSVACFKSNLL